MLLRKAWKMGKSLCDGCACFVERDCIAGGIGSRYEVFREQCCPCTTCVVKMVCDMNYRFYPFTCKPFRKARQKLFEITIKV